MKKTVILKLAKVAILSFVVVLGFAKILDDIFSAFGSLSYISYILAALVVIWNTTQEFIELRRKETINSQSA
jgi:hypothetical protein